jgi:hypothetical protein
MRFAQFAYTGDYSVPTMVVSYQAHQQIQAQKEVEVPPTPFGAFMSNKDSWNFASTSNLVRKDTKTKVVQCSDEEKSQPLSTKHFTTFNKADTYPLLQPRSKFADSCEPEVVAGSEESIDEALLSHNSLYILAEKWGIDSLKALTLFKLHQTLCFFPLDELKVPRIVELARSAYSGTPDLENGIDELRALTCQYIAANSEVMSESTAFTDLIEEGGAFARDLFKCMLPRIR